MRKNTGVAQCLSVTSQQKRHNQVNKSTWPSYMLGEVTQMPQLRNTTGGHTQKGQKAHLPLLVCLIKVCSQQELTVLLLVPGPFSKVNISYETTSTVTDRPRTLSMHTWALHVAIQVRQATLSLLSGQVFLYGVLQEIFCLNLASETRLQ